MFERTYAANASSFSVSTELINVTISAKLSLSASEAAPHNKSIEEQLVKDTAIVTKLDAWELENTIKTILTKLGITSFGKKISETEAY